MSIPSVGLEVLTKLKEGKTPTELSNEFSTATVAKYNKIFLRWQEICNKAWEIVLEVT